MKTSTTTQPNAGGGATHTYINGDACIYTGTSEVIHGGFFYHVRMTEGRHAGQIKVTQRAPDGTNPNDARIMAEWKAQQADFAKLNS